MEVKDKVVNEISTSDVKAILGRYLYNKFLQDRKLISVRRGFYDRDEVEKIQKELEERKQLRVKSEDWVGKSAH